MIGNGWRINNLPYMIASSVEPNDCCPICLDKFSNTKEKAEK